MQGSNAELLKSLEEALTVSPDNRPLRRQYATLLMNHGRLPEAEAALRAGLNGGRDATLELALADCFDRQGERSKALALAENLASRPNAAAATHALLARLLLHSGDLDRAASAYRRAVDEDPELADPDLTEVLGVNATRSATPESESSCDEEDLRWDGETDQWGRVLRVTDGGGASSPVEMEKPEVNFDDVGGMEDLKNEIHLKIIAPIENAELYKAYGKAVGGGMLMYGPPGCGKTHLARATAGQIDAGFVSVGIDDVLDMYLGSSEAKLRALFQYAREHTPCVVFFDEVDALGAKRSDMQGSAGRQVINQFLAEMDGVEKTNEGLLILAATNAPWSLDAAFRRPGRFDRVLFVPPPDPPGAEAILRVLLKGKPQEAIDAQAIVKRCKGFSGADLKAVVDQAVEAKLADALKEGTPRPLTTRDLLKASKQVKPSTREWFSTAKNHALYANEGGHYDDVLDYLKMR